MRPLSASVVHNEQVVGSLARLSLHADALAAAQPGQGLALLQPGALTILAHPFPIAAADAGAHTADVLYDATGHLAPWLALLGPGREIDALGLWGRPFPIDRQARHAVLLGAGRRLVGLL